MTVCRSTRYTSMIHFFNSLTSRIFFLNTAVLFSRFYSDRIQTWAVKVASYLARWIMRSHMLYAIEIGINCEIQVSQGSVATQLRWGGRPCNGYTESFLGNLSVKKMWKSVYICGSYNQRSCIVFLETQCPYV